MPRRSLQVAALVVGAALWIPWAPVAARPLGGTSQGQPPGLLASLWGNLSSLWGAAGCEIDPSGARCVSSHGNAGWASPRTGGGRKLVNVRGAAGCELDPSGARAQNPGGSTGPVCGASVIGSPVAPQIR